MRVAVGADHRGRALKDHIAGVLRRLGHEVRDFGTDGAESVDYPDYAAAVARAVARGECERGVLACATGIGMSIAANKVKGVRAALCRDAAAAEMSRRHNDANVLCLPGEGINEDTLADLLRTWLATQYEEGRHDRRLSKIREIENEG